MSFQFACPQGHLLEGDESMANSQLNCPTCGMLFIVPEPLPPEPAPAPAPAAPDFTRGRGDAFAPATQTSEPKLLHIPCPQGHILETPPDMLGLDVMCPHCGVQFKLTETESLEYKKKKTIAQEAADNKVGTAWFNWAVAFAVLVVIGLIALIAFSPGGK